MREDMNLMHLQFHSYLALNVELFHVVFTHLFFIG